MVTRRFRKPENGVRFPVLAWTVHLVYARGGGTYRVYCPCSMVGPYTPYRVAWLWLLCLTTAQGVEVMVTN